MLSRDENPRGVPVRYALGLVGAMPLGTTEGAQLLEMGQLKAGRVAMRASTPIPYGMPI